MGIFGDRGSRCGGIDIPTRESCRKRPQRTCLLGGAWARRRSGDEVTAPSRESSGERNSIRDQGRRESCTAIRPCMGRVSYQCWHARDRDIELLGDDVVRRVRPAFTRSEEFPQFVAITR